MCICFLTFTFVCVFRNNTVCFICFCMIADSRRLLCSFTVTVSATQTMNLDHTTPYTVTGQTGEFSFFVKRKGKTKIKSSDLVNKLQFVERHGKAAAVTWCLVWCFFWLEWLFYRLTLPGCMVCELVPDHILTVLHRIKETTTAASFVHPPIIQLTVCALF